MISALLIIDVQNDFTEGGALGTEGGAAVAAAITEHVRAHVDAYAIVAASRDWHEATGGNDGHFASDEPDFVDTWPEHCVAGSTGAEYHPSLDVACIDVHILKGRGTAAYSAFEGTTVEGASLSDILRDAGITHVDLVGIATDYCVRASALDAHAAGFRVRVIDRLTSAVAPHSRARALEELEALGVEVVREL